MNQPVKSRRGRRKSQLFLVWRRLARNKSAIIGMSFIIIMILLAVFADVIADYETRVIGQDIGQRMLRPFSPGHLFGTDQFGRDIAARLVHGARLSLLVGVMTVALATTAGIILGSISAYFGGIIDAVIMRMIDIIMSIPIILLAIAIVASLGPGLFNLMIALTVTMIPRFARIIRSSILTVKNLEYIEAARSYGTGHFRMIYRHIIPNAIGPIIIQSTLSLGVTILNIAALSFIGMGVQAPIPEWGSMLSEARKYLRTEPYLLVIPGAAIAMTVLMVNLLGDGLRDALDPRMKN